MATRKRAPKKRVSRAVSAPSAQAEALAALAALRAPGGSSWVCLAPGTADDRGRLHPRAGAKTSGGMSGVMNV